MAEVDISLNFKGGGSIVIHRPVFSLDGENIFTCWKNSILEYNTKTGKMVYEYKTVSHDIIGFSYFMHDSYPCLAVCSKSGKVTIWRTVIHYKMLEKQIPIRKIKTFNIISSETDEIKALVSYESNNIYFSVVDIKKCVTNNCSLTINKVQNQNYFIDISGDKYFSVACANFIYFVNFNNVNIISRYGMKNERTFTCIACHQSEDIVLTGDSSGRVVVWRNIFFKNKIQTVFHWHTLPVRAVCFSTAGSYFYSGGEECVLVKWQLDNANDKKFLPRLADEINFISGANNNTYVALATKDNAIRILNNQMDQIGLIQHMVLGKQCDCGIVYDPKTKALIMNGNRGHLQFYSPQDMYLLYNIDIVGQNKITNERDCVIENTDIRKVAISRNGMWLATIEQRKDSIYSDEIRLKFWKFDNEAQTFELNTSVEYPHDKSVIDILFQPINNDNSVRCVTLGEDKKFKIWQLIELTSVYKKGVAWKCFGVGFYRGLQCSAMSFSVDGSLLAVGFERILTTWTPDTCETKCSLFHPIHKEKIKSIRFGYSNQCHLLVSASVNQLSVWNLLTLCMLWTVPVKMDFLLADPLSTNMAVLTKDKKVFVFTPNSPMPVYTNNILLNKQKDIVAASFIPSKHGNDGRLKWYDRSHLYFINSDNELFCVSGNQTNTDLQDEVSEKEKSVFTMMQPNFKLNLAQADEPKRQLFERDLDHKTLKKFLEAPIQTMVPLRFTCYSLLKCLVIQKETEK